MSGEIAQPIRVLHVFARLNRGGAETMIMNLYRNIDKTLVQFDFIVHTEDKCDYEDEIKKMGGKIFRVPRYIGKNHLVYVKKWKEFFNDHKEYKIIHGHVRSTASIYLSIAKKNGLLTIAHSHSTSSGSGIRAIIKNTLQYPIRYISDYFFACSKPAGKWLFGKKICRSERFYLIKNAIDLAEFTYNKTIRNRKRLELKIDDDDFVVGHIGRFHSPKNHDFIIDVFKDIQNRYKNAILLLIGDGELREKIQRKVKKLQLTNNVIFTGVRKDISELLQAMDVFLFPSLYEGLPVTLVEAQAAGLPCVISDTITDEIKLTSLVESISLNKSIEYWSERVLSYKKNFERYSPLEQLTLQGYEIQHVANWYKDFIIQKYNKVK